MLYYSSRGYGYRRHRKRSDPAKFEKAAEMRNNPTKAEAAMWNIIRSQVYQNFPNYVFYRQSVQYGYILDFYCPRLRLGIEVDGSVHDTNEQKEHDYYRDILLTRHNIEVHRYSNDDVLNHPEETTSKIYSVLRYKNEHPVQGFVEHKGCFIATAAFGTPMAQEIDILRRFRDLKMEPNLIGKYMVNLYYGLSPPLAKTISRSKRLRTFARLVLKPIIILTNSRYLT
jgi:very-short-patch-repair endonuclease